MVVIRDGKRAAMNGFTSLWMKSRKASAPPVDRSSPCVLRLPQRVGAGRQIPYSQRPGLEPDLRVCRNSSRCPRQEWAAAETAQTGCPEQQRRLLGRRCCRPGHRQPPTVDQVSKALGVEPPRSRSPAGSPRTLADSCASVRASKALSLLLSRYPSHSSRPPALAASFHARPVLGRLREADTGRNER